MLFTRLINFFRGCLLIKISGNYPERLINLCTKNNILLWDIVRTGENTVCCKISARGFKLLRGIARRTACRVKIISKHGIKQHLKPLKKRKWFVFGIFVFALAIAVSDLFVWKIDIVGNSKTDAKLILNGLSECGLKKGAFRGSLDEKEIKNKMLLKMPELSWIWPNLNGARVVVEVKEKAPMPEIYNPSDYTHIIAKKDGIISAMTVKAGSPAVKIGDTVLKGDVLVSGAIEFEKDVPPRYVQAEAEVFARVWYEKTRAFSTVYVRKNETGNIEKKHTLKIGGLKIKLYGKEEPGFESFSEENRVWEFSPFGYFSGISVETSLFRETTEQTAEQSAESVAADGVLQLTAEIESEAQPSGERINITHTENFPDEDTVIVTVTAEYIENIAQKQKGNQ